MKRVQKALVGAVTGAALLASASFTQAQDAADTNSSAIGAGAQPTMQYCVPGCVVGPMTDADMHYGMMGQGMMGQGMMNQGAMGQGMMNQGATPMMGMAAAAPLDADHVRPHLEQHLAMMGLPNLMLGSIEAEDDDTLVAEIVTRDGTLVQRLAIDRHSGAVTPLE